MPEEEGPLSLSPSSSLACKLFGMGKSTSSLFPTPFRSQSGLNSQGQGRHFGVLTRQRVTGLLPPSDSRGDNQREILWLRISLMSQTLFFSLLLLTRLFCSGHLWQIQDVVENLAHRFHLPPNSPPFSFFEEWRVSERWEERLDGDRDSITLARAKAAAQSLMFVFDLVIFE